MICQEFEEALCHKKDFFIRFPYTVDEVQDAIDDFEAEYKFPQIVGAIDGSHVEINAPLENNEDYFNRNQYYSVNLQGIVNAQLLFQHIAGGFPGSIHDARVLRLSGIFDLVENGDSKSANKSNSRDALTTNACGGQRLSFEKMAVEALL